MNLGLKGKTALVFGAGGGLGKVIARTLAREGAQVALADIDLSSAETVAEEIRVGGGSATALSWDLADRKIIPEKVKQIETTLGPIDVLLNNTGGPPPTLSTGQDPELWLKHFEAMVLSVIAITDHVLPRMRERGWGRIITSTSSGVISPIPNLAISNALRLTLLGWSKTMAREIGRDGVTTNIILPGRIATDRIHTLDKQKAEREGRTVEAVARESTSSIPIGRYGDPQEYADVVAFLASMLSSYITGSVIRVDGGLIQSI